MDHLAMKHFRDQMISELRKDAPLRCPRCNDFESKDRQQLFRHMISKHKVLDHYLQVAIDKMKADGKQPYSNQNMAGANSAMNGGVGMIPPQQILIEPSLTPVPLATSASITTTTTSLPPQIQV